MDYLIYFIVTIAILVFVHEFGHFAAAKISKMRVDVFAIGFGKRLFGFNKLTGFTFGNLPTDFDGQGNTDYRLCLLPFGGYVKITGMVDESLDTKSLESEPKPYEFRAKSTIAKLFVITAGVAMNLLLTLVIFWGINFFQGKQVFNTTTIHRIESDSKAAEVGFKSGDSIVEINGVFVNNWDDVVENLIAKNLTTDATVTVYRDSAKVNLNIPRKFINDSAQEGFFLVPSPSQPVIIEVVKNSPAEDAGLKPRDIILEMNNEVLTDGLMINNIITSNKTSEISIVLLRDLDTIRTMVKPSMEGKIGISHSLAYTGNITYKTYGFLTSITQSFANAADYTVLTLSMLKNVITGKIEFKQAFGGPVKIAQFAAKSADTGIIAFLYFLAMLSLSLAIINILPFPVLDGGHFVIILIEGLFRRELPLKVKIVIQNTGFAILLLLMAFIIYNDLISL
ncbi:MAG: RIP metalloprotease RseP [Melioribacteraceae bacterium]|nr:RIP metalloprotease RseP [Melioribacteraceae bacterium]